MLKSAEKLGGSTAIRQWVPDRRSANAFADSASAIQSK